MKTSLQFNDVDEISATLSISMKLRDWRDLQRALGTAWPASELSYAITDLLSKAQKTLLSDGQPT